MILVRLANTFRHRTSYRILVDACFEPQIDLHSTTTSSAPNIFGNSS